jgi:hypothetical protein
MSLNRNLLVIAASILAVLVLVVGIQIIRLWIGNAHPLCGPPPIDFSSISAAETQRFLEGDFEVIRRVEDLPQPVLIAFTEQGGSRLLIANPGTNFQATDVVVNASVPSKRLIFAGVSDNKCFVHYEQGGIARSYVLAFFTLTSADKMKAVWQGYCGGAAADIQDLRSKFTNGVCSHSPYSDY